MTNDSMRKITPEDVEENILRREEEAKQAREKAEKDSLRASWIKSGGEEKDFEKEWPSIRREQIRREALEREELAKQTSARQLRASF